MASGVSEVKREDSRPEVKPAERKQQRPPEVQHEDSSSNRGASSPDSGKVVNKKA